MIIGGASMFGSDTTVFAPSAVFVAATTSFAFTSTLSTPTPASLGAVAGDLGILETRYPIDPPVRGSGLPWSDAIDLHPGESLRFCQLTAADLTVPITFNRGAQSYNLYSLLFWRGASTMVQKGQNLQKPPTVPGFVKNGSHAGIIGFAIKGASTTPTFATPATFALRHTSFDGGSRILTASDRLYPPNALYVNGTSFTLNGASDAFTTATIFELRT